MEKSPDAFRTISEVADWLGVPTHVLRFWESKFTQVKPVKRAGGRRYYRPADMALLGGIRKLLHDDGMTIKGVQKLLREQGTSHVASFSQPLGTEAEIDIEVAPEPVTDQGENVVQFTGRSEEPPAQPDTAVPEPEPKAEREPEPVSATTAAPDSEPQRDAEVPSEAVEEDDAPTLPAFLTQPMGGTEQETPKPRLVDAPDPPPEADIAVRPGVLGQVAGITHLDADQARALAPLISRLAVLRDNLAGASG